MRSLFEGEKAVVRHQPRHEPVFHGVAGHYQPSPRLRGIDHPTSGESFACTRSIPTSLITWSRCLPELIKSAEWSQDGHFQACSCIILRHVSIGLLTMVSVII